MTVLRACKSRMCSRPTAQILLVATIAFFMATYHSFQSLQRQTLTTIGNADALRTGQEESYSASDMAPQQHDVHGRAETDTRDFERAAQAYQWGERRDGQFAVRNEDTTQTARRWEERGIPGTDKRGHDMKEQNERTTLSISGDMRGDNAIENRRGYNLEFPKRSPGQRQEMMGAHGPEVGPRPEPEMNKARQGAGSLGKVTINPPGEREQSFSNNNNRYEERGKFDYNSAFNQGNRKKPGLDHMYQLDHYDYESHKQHLLQGLTARFDISKIHRLVHLDLKGAPPNVDYLREVIPLVARWGASGLLIEYEDMFPYWDELKVLARADAYNASIISEIQRVAAQSDLIVVPLVQTFGHIEFVLKHSAFSKIRESQQRIKNLNPAHMEASYTVRLMIDQILGLHPNAKYIHIGCDEVYDLGTSNESRKMMQYMSLDKHGLYLEHVKKVLKYIDNMYPKVKRLMWDDMLRKIPIERLQKAELGNLVEPMIWHYTSKVHQTFTERFWSNYSRVFPKVWVASAFKGSTGNSRMVVNIKYQLMNHISWSRMMKHVHAMLFPKLTIQGIALTGWSRYEHFQPLTEILPVALPALASCLISVNNKIGDPFTEKVHEKFSKALRCRGLLHLLPAQTKEQHTQCKFPGSDIYDAVSGLATVLQRVSDHQRTTATISAARVNNARNQLLVHVRNLPSLLLKVLNKSDTREFMMTNIVNRLNGLALRDFKEEATSVLYHVYPWMKEGGYIEQIQ